jgi:thioredoxin-like negative regulator of GroEL
LAQALFGENNDVRTGGSPMLLFFTRETSGPARRMESLLAHVARKERGRLRVRRIDADEHPGLVEQFEVSDVPCLLLVIDRKVADRIEGRANMPQIERLLEEHLPAEEALVVQAV